MNLPNAITVGRIASAPLIAVLPLAHSWELRLVAFLLFIAAAVTDYVDGMLARNRNLVTDLGRLLDPLADKLLLVATLVPMFLLAGSGWDASLLSPHTEPARPGFPGPMLRDDGGFAFPLVTPWGPVGIPWWILAVVLGREIFMTIMRQAAARRGVIIAAIGLAKWKTGFQSTWVGATYFWFFAATLGLQDGWSGRLWDLFAQFNGIVAVSTMIVAVLLTVSSLALYLRRYAAIFAPTSG